ncbi:MAG: hypothetical protein ACFFDW_15380, partial [Candidatus Thorarchaeota archaeon]
IADRLDKEEASLTLRLRELAGLIKVSGDLAIVNREDRISFKHVRAAIDIAKPIEDQIIQKYGSFEEALKSEHRSFSKSNKEDEEPPYNSWNG